MERWKKISYPLAIIMVLAGICVCYWGFSTQQGWSRTEIITQIWLPNNYHLLNKVSESYRSMVDIQLEGTVVSISLKEFKELFDNATIAVTSKGIVHYFTNEGKLTIMTSEQLTVEGNFPEEVRMLSDKDIKLVDDITIETGFMCFFGILGLGVLGLFIGFLIDQVLPK